MSERERCVFFAATRPPPGDDKSAHRLPRADTASANRRVRPQTQPRRGKSPAPIADARKAEANLSRPARRIPRKSIRPAQIANATSVKNTGERNPNTPGDPNGKVLNQKTYQDRVADRPDRRLQPSGEPISRGHRHRNQHRRPKQAQLVGSREHWRALAFNSPALGRSECRKFSRRPIDHVVPYPKLLLPDEPHRRIPQSRVALREASGNPECIAASPGRAFPSLRRDAR